MVTLDRSSGLIADGLQSLWTSDAEMAARMDEKGWTIELRIPVAAARGRPDPLRGVEGRRPTSSQPWYFNICRQRVRAAGAETSAFSPTGRKQFHELSRFARLCTMPP